MRWWEHYFVRYLVGTVSGSALIILLSTIEPYKSTLSPLLSFKDAELLGIGLIGAVGFAYCYIASAPILTLHALRAHIRMGSLVADSRRNLIVATIALTTGVLGGIVAHHFEVPALAYWTVAPIVLFQFCLITVAWASGFRTVESYYRDLATRRSDAAMADHGRAKPSPGTEYVTSYRHLREHGNAKLIVILEVILATALYKVTDAHYVPLVIGIWLLPAALTWIVGTVLESRFVTNAV